MPHSQLGLAYHTPPSLNELRTHRQFPSTRYQGSKLKFLDWLKEPLEQLHFDSAIDLFGGTGAVSYLLKTLGKRVQFNDILRFNWHIGSALIANPGVAVDDALVETVGQPKPGKRYNTFIQDTFNNIYFTDEENVFLDIITQNIHDLRHPLERSAMLFCLFQACIAKRPYNLFHRANLYMRTADVQRSFGNKATWDRPFIDHMKRAAAELRAAVFDNGHENSATCSDATDLAASADLVYIDPPYMSEKAVSVDYLEFYHFLEGLSDYEAWPAQVDRKRKHQPFGRRLSPWLSKTSILGAFDTVFERFQGSQLVVSYRNDGIPTIEELATSLRRHRRSVRIEFQVAHKYALSKKSSKEVLIIAEPRTCLYPAKDL
jgi:adenine-specific DNA-methyltransferase